MLGIHLSYLADRSAVLLGLANSVYHPADYRSVGAYDKRAWAARFRSIPSQDFLAVRRTAIDGAGRYDRKAMAR